MTLAEMRHRLVCAKCGAVALFFEGGLRCLEHPGADMRWLAAEQVGRKRRGSRQEELFG